MTVVFRYSCNKDITLKMPEYRPKHVGENSVNKIHHKYSRAFVGYLYIMITVFDNVSHSSQVCYIPLPELQTIYVLNTRS